MISFADFYNMIEEAKQPTFRQYVTSLYNDLALIKDYRSTDYKKKPNFTSADYERATFSFTKEFGSLSDTDIDTMFKKCYQWTQGIAAIIGISGKPEQSYKMGKTIYVYGPKKLKNGVTVTYTSTFVSDYHYPYTTDTFEFIGKKLENNQTEFEKYPEFKPGEILYVSYGYNATHVDFYQIVKRSGVTLYLKSLKKDYISGGGYTGKVTTKKDDFNTEDKEIYTARLPNPKIEKINAYLWDGKPKYYNTMD